MQARGGGVSQERPHQGRGTSAGFEGRVNPGAQAAVGARGASSGSVEENGVSKEWGCRGKSAHGGAMGRARASCPCKGFRLDSPES